MRSKLLCLICVGFFCCTLSAHSQNHQDTSFHTQLRSLVNLLDYIGKDYPNAVKDASVVSASEYQEMNDFSDQITNLQKKLAPKVDKKSFSSLDAPIHQLSEAVDQKAPQEKIKNIASGIQQKILVLNLITITPSSWPDLEHGKKVFLKSCKSCHGAKGFGDGPLAKNLTPAPANFHDSTLAANLSPLQVYNTARLGIEGTSMRAFQELSDKEVWDVAFYINQLNYGKEISDAKAQKIKKDIQGNVSLKKLAIWKNSQWTSYFDKKNISQATGLAVLRSMNASDKPARQNDHLAKAIDLLNQADAAYSSRNTEHAQTLALNAYLKGVEPVENEIKAAKSGLVTELENKMIDTRSAIKQNKPVDEVHKKISQASLAIQQTQELLSEQDYSFWFTFMMSASILLREGLEAVLIILVIISVLKSMGAERSLRYVHAGWVVALILGIMSWFFTETLIQMSSFQREIMEGVGSLIAVGMLVYIGFWLHNKTHASQWKQFVKEKITRLVNENNRWGLAFLAFVVVFREAFESVIFLSSVSIKSGASGNTGILFGAASAIGAVFLLAFIMVYFSQKIPIRSLFQYSSLIMSFLAVVLVGKGIHEFQEAGYIGIHSLPAFPGIPLIGFYPTLFTILAQVLIAGCIFGLWRYSKKRALAANS